jgi:uncharacterized protein DUF1569
MKSLSNQRDKEEVLRRLREVGSESSRRWGRMSAHQMICHLNDSFKAAMGEKAISRASRLLPGRLMKLFALYVPLRWPHGVPTMPEMNQERGGTRPGEFAADVAELERLLDRITVEQTDFNWGVHPLFGAMPDRDWLRWGYLHMDHHLRQFGV